MAILEVIYKFIKENWIIAQMKIKRKTDNEYRVIALFILSET